MKLKRFLQTLDMIRWWLLVGPSTPKMVCIMACIYIYSIYIYLYIILVIHSPTSPGLLGTPGLQAVIAKALPGHASGHAVYHWDAFHFFQSQFQVYIVYGSVLLALSFLQLVYFIYICVYHIYNIYIYIRVCV